MYIFGHSLASANARKPIKCSKDADSRLVCFKIKKTGNCNVKLFSGADYVTWIPPWRLTAPHNVQSPKCPSFENQTKRLSASLESLISYVAVYDGVLRLQISEPIQRLSRSCIFREVETLINSNALPFLTLRFLTKNPQIIFMPRHSNPENFR